MITLAPDAPRWATAGGRGGNYKVSASEVRGLRARGRHAATRASFGGLPAVKLLVDLERAQPHLLPQAALAGAADLPRAWSQRGAARAARDRPARLEDLRRRARAGRHRDQGDRARCASCSSGCASTSASSACAARSRASGRAASSFKKVTANGFAHHPYGPTDARPGAGDIINMLAIRRLGAALDRAARAGRITRGLPIYNTEFGFQTNPPDPFVSTSPGAAGGAPQREGGVLLPLLAAEELLAVPAVRRPRPLGLVGAALGRLPDRPAVRERQARSRPSRPTSCRSSCTGAAAACRSGATCAPARAPASCSCSGAAAAAS